VAAQALICEELSFVNWGDLLDRLEFYDDSIVDHDVHSVAAIQVNALVDDWPWHLPHIGHTCLCEIEAKTFFICRLEQSQAQISVHLDRHFNDLSAEPHAPMKLRNA
jgi:hypothetical protein